MISRYDLLWIGVGRAIAAIVALCSLRAITIFLHPEQYGELTLLLAVQTFCGLLFVNPIGQYINLHTHAWWDDGSLFLRLKKYSSYVVLVALIGALFYWLIVNTSANDGGALIVLFSVFLVVIAATWNATLIPMLNMLGFRAESVFLGVSTAVLSLLVSIFFVSWHPSAVAWLWGQVIGLGVGAIAGKYLLQKKTNRLECDELNFSLINVSTVMSYCLPLAIATSLMWLQLSGYRFVVEHYWGLKKLAFFAIGFQLANQIWSLAESLVVQFLYPYFYRRISDADSNEAKVAFSDLLNTLLPVYLLLMGLSAIGAPYILRLLVASPFWDGASFLVIGAGVELCRTIANLLGNAAQITRRTISLAAPYAVGALFCFVGFFVAGEMQFDIYWAGVIMLFSSVSMLLTMFISMYFQVRYELDVFRFFTSLLISVLMFLTSLYIPVLDGLAESVMILTLIATLGGGMLFLVLWRNPATLRLLTAKLRSR